MEKIFAERISQATSTRIESIDGTSLIFGKLEPIRGNTGDYSEVENK